jgi:hypothetical protein
VVESEAFGALPPSSAGDRDILMDTWEGRAAGQWGCNRSNAAPSCGRDLGRITESQYKQVNIEFSKAGYRSREPVELPRESPTLLREAIEERIAAGEDVRTIAESALMTVAEFRRVYGGEEDRR